MFSVERITIFGSATGGREFVGNFERDFFTALAVEPL